MRCSAIKENPGNWYCCKCRAATLAERHTLQARAVANARASRKVKARKHAPVVYFIEATGFDRVKIGTSCNLEERITDIKVGCPTRPELMFTIAGGLEEEKELHARFAHAHVQGEWFVLSAIESELLALYTTRDKELELTLIGRCPGCGTAQKQRYKRRSRSGLCKPCSIKLRVATQAASRICIECGAAGALQYHTQMLCETHREEAITERRRITAAKVSESMRGNQNAARSARGRILLPQEGAKYSV